MKRIGIDVSCLANEQKTGIGVYCFNLIDNLLKIDKKDKFILFAITPLDCQNKDINYFKKYPNVEIKIIKLPVQLFRRLFLLWQKLEWPTIETFIGKVDIFHSFNLFLPPQKSGKRVATFYDLSSIIYPEFHKRGTTQLDNLRFKRMVKVCDLILTISQFSKNEFLKKWPKKWVEVIYPGVREVFDQKISETESDKVLKKNNLEKGYFLFVGTLEPRKNVENLIKAFSLQLSAFRQKQKGLTTDSEAILITDDSKLIIVGASGWSNEGVYDLPKKLGVGDRVRFLDFVSDKELVILYKNALCLVYPSIYEGFGLPVVEAFSMGIPVITSNTASLAEIGKNAAFLVDPLDTIKIASGMKKVFIDTRLRNSLIKKGKMKVKEFSWVEGAKQLLKYYYLLSD